jgi:predicted short-subunit dehydrogenase-like oxidoreductase (DUF2520 family)
LPLLYCVNSFSQVNLVGTTPWGTITTLGHCITSSVSIPIVTNFLLTLRHRCDWLAPTAVVTDGDKTLWAAVEQAYPLAGHYICIWHFGKALYVLRSEHRSISRVLIVHRNKRIQTSTSIDKKALYRAVMVMASAADEQAFFDLYARAKVSLWPP